MLVEFVDLIFAVDSVPAIFAITTDPFIVYTSNIFAILGLRALYFALAAMIHRFKYLKYALALVLVFIGCKIFLVGIIGKIPRGDLAQRDLRPDRRRRAGLAVEDARAGRGPRVFMTDRSRNGGAAVRSPRPSGCGPWCACVGKSARRTRIRLRCRGRPGTARLASRGPSSWRAGPPRRRAIEGSDGVD